jgi:hypothetical protein
MLSSVIFVSQINFGDDLLLLKSHYNTQELLCYRRFTRSMFILNYGLAHV